MTKEEFEKLQLDIEKSGMNIHGYLAKESIKCSTYYAWKKRYSPKSRCRDLAPISIRSPKTAEKSCADNHASGVTLLFPNGLRAHFESGTDTILMELLKESIAGHVQP